MATDDEDLVGKLAALRASSVPGKRTHKRSWLKKVCASPECPKAGEPFWTKNPNQRFCSHRCGWDGNRKDKP